MPLDAICLRAVLNEIAAQSAGARVEKVYQADRDEIVLALRGKGGAQRLLICASPNAPRIHFISTARENPAAPPMFCMLLRKHLQGAKIAEVSQPDLERVCQIEFDTTDDMGYATKKYLFCELMNGSANIILCDAEKRILDSIRRVEGDLAAGKRQLLPGLFYHLPPAQLNKKSPLAVSGAGLAAAIQGASGEKTLDKWLLSCFYGVSPLVCRELSFRACGDAEKPIHMLSAEECDKLCTIFSDFTAFIEQRRFQPYLLQKPEDAAAFDFSFFPITQYGNAIILKPQPSFSALLSTFYERRDKAERMRRRAQDMQRTVTTARDRLVRKLNIQQQELARTENREKFKRMGDLITANLYQIEPETRVAHVVDYYAEDCPEIDIALDIRFSPQQNAQLYYKKYNKAKTAEIMLTEQLAQGQDELFYLESVLESISEAENEQDLAQLREELVQTGYLSYKQQKNGRQKPANAVPFHYKTTDGFDVFAGKNNLQNDLLTLKTAYKTDIWFHTQKIHGSHVILVTDGAEPTDRAMTEAACIAAFHSKARNSAQVPVDYSQVRNIKKPAGAKPGFVIYHVYHTAYVTPNAEEIDAMRVK